MKRARILIVEDNPVNLKLASIILEAANFQVLEAGDASQAREVINTTTPDLILMDIALPGMDGLALTRLLKADEKTRHIPIVALTAYAMRGDDEKAKAAGCDSYITKPIDVGKLPDQVAEILGRSDGEHKRSV